MEQKNSRGGVKPRMLAQSEDWGIDTGQSYFKKGIYEFNARTGELARRVELPEWLDEQRKVQGPAALLSALSQGQVQPPRVEIGESRGHIFVSPGPESGFAGSAVGVDVEMFDKMQRLGTSAKWIRFPCYGPYNAPAFSCRMAWADFARLAKRVQTKPQFMPQMMVGMSELKLFVSR